MATRASHLVASVRDSFWFLPGVCVALSIVLAESVVLLDRLVPVPDWANGVILEVGADGSRGLLTAIAGSMLGAAATMFSITIAVLALTSSNYGPRLVRNFMADRGNQFVLGGLVSIALYALLVVRHVRIVTDGEVPFVPHLAVNLAVALLVGGIGLLVYFIHHIATDIQVSTLSSKVRRELIELINEQFPLDADADADADEGAVAPADTDADTDADTGRQWFESPGVAVVSKRDGYVGSVAIDELVSAARKRNLRVDVVIQPGTYVVTGDPLALISGAEGGHPADDARRELEKAVTGAISIDDQRTPYQDLEHLVRQLIDLAVRALSPGTNDPFTAINALDDLSAALSHGIARPDAAPILLDDDGVVRVRVVRRRVVELTVDALDVVKPYAVGHTVVVCRALLLVQRVTARAAQPHDRVSLMAAADRLVDAHNANAPSEFEVQRVLDARAACVAPRALQ
jgi:uncharacterized membrane protein